VVQTKRTSFIKGANWWEKLASIVGDNMREAGGGSGSNPPAGTKKGFLKKTASEGKTRAG